MPAFLQVKELKAHPDMANLITAKNVLVVGAYYAFNGAITFFGEDAKHQEANKKECQGWLRYFCWNSMGTGGSSMAMTTPSSVMTVDGTEEVSLSLVACYTLWVYTGRTSY